jgi:myo-inositol-1(or 4)-monophosphatase
MSTTKEREELAAIALGVAREAAELVAKGYRSRPASDEKSQKDLVTAYDRASEQLATRLLTERTGLRIVGEETAPSVDEEPRRGRVWFVDPIDGTTNFVHGHPFWCVSIGLMEDDAPVAGAVVAPALSVTWTGFVASDASRPSEARRNGERCQVSPVAELRRALVATGFPPDRETAPQNNFDSFQSVKRRAQAVRRCGSAAMDLCMVGDGTYEGYWERRLHSWDAAAACAVVIAAGGRITSLTGGPPDYHVGHIVASNGLIHDALVAAVQG